MARNRTFFGFSGDDAGLAMRFASEALRRGADQVELGKVLWWASSQYQLGRLSHDRLYTNLVSNFDGMPKTLKAVLSTYDEANEKGWDEVLPPEPWSPQWDASFVRHHKDTPPEKLNDYEVQILADIEARRQEKAKDAPATDPQIPRYVSNDHRLAQIDEILKTDPDRYHREHLGSEFLKLTRDAESAPAPDPEPTDEPMDDNQPEEVDAA